MYILAFQETRNISLDRVDYIPLHEVNNGEINVYYTGITRAWWHLKPPTNRMFAQQLAQADIKESTKVPYYGDRWLSSQMTHTAIMMTSSNDVIPRYWPFVRGIHRSPVNSQHKGQWRGALMLSLICVSINGCVNNREDGDLRRHRPHYDVIVMMSISMSWHHH